MFCGGPWNWRYAPLQLGFFFSHCPWSQQQGLKLAEFFSVNYFNSWLCCSWAAEMNQNVWLAAQHSERRSSETRTFLLLVGMECPWVRETLQTGVGHIISRLSASAVTAISRSRFFCWWHVQYLRTLCWDSCNVDSFGMGCFLFKSYKSAAEIDFLNRNRQFTVAIATECWFQKCWRF